MNVHRRQPFDPDRGEATPESVVMGRRRWLRAAGFVGAATVAGGGALYLGRDWWRGDPAEVLGRGAPSTVQVARQEDYYPMTRDERFAYGRPQTDEVEAARYANFYEFASHKRVWRLVETLKTDPWTVTIAGLCKSPRVLDIDELLKRYRPKHSERLYRHRCVERWAMAVPWSGFPLSALLKDIEPLPTATHVRFVSFNRPDQAPGISASPSYPWPYTEGLTIAEAMNELVLVATGMYGHPLLKQHGAPVRLVVPWKYGYKSIKSIERIELVDRQPVTFWSTLAPDAYPFESNVEPDVPRPWPQHEERMLGSGERYATQPYNGYGEHVAHLYRA